MPTPPISAAGGAMPAAHLSDPFVRRAFERAEREDGTAPALAIPAPKPLAGGSVTRRTIAKILGSASIIGAPLLFRGKSQATPALVPTAAERAQHHYTEFAKAWNERRLPMRYEPRDAAVEVYRFWRERNGGERRVADVPAG